MALGDTPNDSNESEFSLLSEVQRIYYLNLLTLKKAKWDRESTDQAIIEAKVDLNPHQVEAATFAFRNPLAGGVILADEVGLGKTIETGLVLSQLWAEGKRSVLIVAPKSLRHQWQDELRNLFGLESSIVDTQIMKAFADNGSRGPHAESEKILITNEHFFNKYATAIQNTRAHLKNAAGAERRSLESKSRGNSRLYLPSEWQDA